MYYKNSQGIKSKRIHIIFHTSTANFVEDIKTVWKILNINWLKNQKQIWNLFNWELFNKTTNSCV